MDDVYFGLCSNEFLLDITYDLANVFGMLGEDPGDEGYDDPYDEDSHTVQTIILPGNDLVCVLPVFPSKIDLKGLKESSERVTGTGA